MTTLAINKLWSFLQSLSMTASNERWLAERLLESADAKTKLLHFSFINEEITVPSIHSFIQSGCSFRKDIARRSPSKAFTVE